jgi:hypothetical protein
MNRVESINFGGNPTRNMSILLAKLNPSGIVPSANKYYTFVYKAKTKGIQYDQHPLILCGNVYKWGFTGENVHIGSRQYSWNEVLSNVYEISEEEFQTLTEVPLAKFKTT